MAETIQTGANKMTSNATTIEIYDTVMDGVRENHIKVLKLIEINKRKIAPPALDTSLDISKACRTCQGFQQSLACWSSSQTLGL